MNRLLELAKNGNSKAIRAELENYRKNNSDMVLEVNIKDKKGRTPLFIAAERGDINTMNVLFSAREIDINNTDNNNVTPLHVAVKKGNVDAVVRLLEQDANIEAEDMQGNTPLFYAVDCVINSNVFTRNKATKILLLLLITRANVNHKNKVGNTPLHIASKCDNAKLLQILILFGANIDAKNNEGITAFELSGINRNIEINAILAKLNVSLKKADLTGERGNETAILNNLDVELYEAIREDMSVVSKMITNINIKNTQGVSHSTPEAILTPLSLPTSLPPPLPISPPPPLPSSPPPSYSLRTNSTSSFSNSSSGEYISKKDEEDVDSVNNSILLEGKKINWDKFGLIYLAVPKSKENDNCFYDAISRYGVGKDQNALRNMVAGYLEKHPESFLNFEVNRSLTSYIDGIKNGIEMANDHQIKMLMRLLNRPFVIINPDEKNMQSFGSEYSGNTVFLTYSNNHYDILLVKSSYTEKEITDTLKSYFINIRDMKLSTVTGIENSTNNENQDILIKSENSNSMPTQVAEITTATKSQLPPVPPPRREREKTDISIPQVAVTEATTATISEIPPPLPPKNRAKANNASSHVAVAGAKTSSTTASTLRELKVPVVQEQNASQSESVHRTVSKPSLSGLIYQPVPGDGHCLFNAVALYLGQTQEFLRNIVAAHIEYSQEQYREVIQTANPKKTFAQYLEDLRQGVEWADDLEIAVLIKMLNRPIVVVGPDNQIRNRLALSGSGDPIFVLYNGHNHYDALILTGEKSPTEILNAMTQLIEHSPQSSRIAERQQTKSQTSTAPREPNRNSNMIPNADNRQPLTNRTNTENQRQSEKRPITTRSSITVNARPVNSFKDIAPGTVKNLARTLFPDSHSRQQGVRSDNVTAARVGQEAQKENYAPPVTRRLS